MTGRADHGSQPWRYPQTLSYGVTTHPRRGTASEVLAGLRRLQGGGPQTHHSDAVHEGEAPAGSPDTSALRCDGGASWPLGGRDE